MEDHVEGIRLRAFVLEDQRLDEEEYAHLLQWRQCIAAMLEILHGSSHRKDPED
jgi:hypothetical protein